MESPAEVADRLSCDAEELRRHSGDDDDEEELSPSIL